MRLDWLHDFGYETISVSVTIGKLFAIPVLDCTLDTKHKV